MSELILFRDMRKTNCIVREIRFHLTRVCTFIYGHISGRCLRLVHLITSREENDENVVQP